MHLGVPVKEVEGKLCEVCEVKFVMHVMLHLFGQLPWLTFGVTN
jgi:hypothetical protein